MSALGNKKIMAENIRRYMTINNVNQSDICKTLNIKMTTFSDWVNAKTYPRIDKIELLANYFGINKSDLVEDATDNKIDDEITQQILKLIPALSEEQKQMFLTYVETVAAKESSKDNQEE